MRAQRSQRNGYRNGWFEREVRGLRELCVVRGLRQHVPLRSSPTRALLAPRRALAGTRCPPGPACLSATSAHPLALCVCEAEQWSGESSAGIAALPWPPLRLQLPLSHEH